MIIKPLVLDLSHHNIVTDYAAVKAAGVVGIIYKASEGIGYKDVTYSVQRVKALDAGLLWGAYHFNTGQDVAAQVDHFFECARPESDTLMALDFEDNPKSNMSAKQAKQFLDFGDKMLGHKLVLYGGNRIKELMPKSDKFLASHRLWLCQYGARPKLPSAWSEYWIWQYAADGVGPKPHTVRGVKGNPDVNTSERTPEQLKAEWAGGPAFQ